MAKLVENSRFGVVFLLALVLGNLSIRAEARAFFVFGDSLVDNGNNNYLATTARADAPPYGIDYPTHRPTGRFSNGHNIPDLISEQMGWEATLPYLNPELNGQKLLVGANFASAGVGVLNDTGFQFVNIIRIYEQLNFFQQYQQRVSAIIGEEQTKKLVKESLVLMTLGGNDFVNNYYLVPYSASRQFPLPKYVPYVISEYKKVLQGYSDRKRAARVCAGRIGASQHQRECAEELQKAAALFNPQLVQMLNELNEELGSTVFIAANTNQMHMDFISNPQAFGFTTSKIACCGQGPYNGLGLCTPFSNLCPNRTMCSGSLPPIREGQQVDCAADLGWLHSLHAPNEPLHHHGLGFKGLTPIF
ncbi:GDSL esterase/lipase [Sesamum angolense]|uniref:GDSL esterase/lipase n=1 Tax=Sesamum angolense TaxID=2727404 RepID=A0AAE2BTZ0_9LAMI|nr:GDSL esterase/lipase [Sesamum angolense]